MQARCHSMWTSLPLQTAQEGKTNVRNKHGIAIVPPCPTHAIWIKTFFRNYTRGQRNRPPHAVLYFPVPIFLCRCKSPTIILYVPHRVPFFHSHPHHARWKHSGNRKQRTPLPNAGRCIRQRMPLHLPTHAAASANACRCIREGMQPRLVSKCTFLSRKRPRGSFYTRARIIYIRSRK